MPDTPAPDALGALDSTLNRLADFLPRISGSLVVDGPLGRIQLSGRHDTVVVNLAKVPELSEVRALFARPPGPERVAPDTGASATAKAKPSSSKREAASRAREQTRRMAAALDRAGLTLRIEVAEETLATVGRSADPGVVTRALKLGKVDLSGRTAFKLARELLT